MKKLTILFGLLISFTSLSQTTKTFEATENDPRKEAREEQRVRQEWDREEAEARQMEEEKRLLDEERAETDIVQPLPKTQRK